jgi:hypothetical protein
MQVSYSSEYLCHSADVTQRAIAGSDSVLQSADVKRIDGTRGALPWVTTAWCWRGDEA